MTQSMGEAPDLETPSVLPAPTTPPTAAPLRVMFATDGSEPSRVAAECLAQLPLPAGSTIRLATVLADDTWEIPPYLRSAEREWALQNFAQAETVLAREGVEIRHSLLIGEPAGEILHEAGATREDLLVLGTHGRSGLSGMLLGSVAVNVARHARQPVLVARRSTPELRRVILGVDGSEHATQATRLLTRFPWPADAQITVCHVTRPYVPLMGPEYTPSMWEIMADVRSQQVRDAEQFAGAAAAELRHAGLQAETVVREGDPAAELAQLAEEQGAGLIVVGARGISAIQALLVGSVADRVLRQAACSVLIVHAE